MGQCFSRKGKVFKLKKILENNPDSYNDLTAETMGHGLLGVRENLTLEAGISAKTATSVVLGLW